MDLITSSAEMTAWSNRQIASRKTIALVPTMGCLHEGHYSLMRDAAQQADFVVASIFVNPLQFGSNEDLDTYPRTFAADQNGAAANGVRVLFAPDVKEFYPIGFQSAIHVGELTRNLCGASRPGHFDGVATVVAKLFNIVKPQMAVFGQKDFQQLAVLRRMVLDLSWDIELVGHPIVREKDGLAMSSRNRNLSASERQSALILFTSLRSAQRKVADGVLAAQEIIKHVQKMICSVPFTAIDYVSIVDDQTLDSQEKITSSCVMALAVVVGKTRLIDNGYLVPKEY